MATNGTYIPSISTDYPLILSIGKPYFESYQTWPDTKFIHGFNEAANTSTDRRLLLDTVPLVCKALEGGKLAYWEFGNEPDRMAYLKSTARYQPGLTLASVQNKRPRYQAASELDNTRLRPRWLNATQDIRDALQQSCPEDASSEAYKYYAPSFAGTNNNGFNVSLAVSNGLNTDNDIGIVSSHKSVLFHRIRNIVLVCLDTSGTHPVRIFHKFKLLLTFPRLATSAAPLLPA